MAGRRERRGGKKYVKPAPRGMEELPSTSSKDVYEDYEAGKHRIGFLGFVGRFFALLFTGVLLLGSVTAGGLFAASKLDNVLQSQMNNVAVKPSQPVQTSHEQQPQEPLPEGRINALLVGTDKAGSNTDVLMLVSYDIDAGKIYLTSILRDFWAVNNGKGHRVNSCMALGGDELLLETVTDLTGVNIDYYAKVDTSGFRDVINILGGVDFYVPMRLKYTDPAQDLYIDLEEGMQHLDGDKAEQLVRFRKPDRGYPTYPRGDYQRTEVQRDFIKAVIEQKFNASLITKAPELYATLTQYITTNFTATDMLKYVGLATEVMKLSSDDIVSFELKAVDARVGAAAVQIPDIEYNLELCRQYFGGSGTSEELDMYKSNFKKYGGVTAVAQLTQPQETEEKGDAQTQAGQAA